MAKSSFRDVDKGWRRIHRELRSLHGANTTIGFHKGPKHDKKRFFAPKGKFDQVTVVTSGHTDVPDIATIAAWQVFGTKKKNGAVHIPRRDFMGGAFIRYGADLIQLKVKLLDGIYRGTYTSPRALAILGQRHEDQIKREITTDEWAPNAPYTIEQKGSDRPLINTSQMRQSVRHVETINPAGATPVDLIGIAADEGAAAVARGAGLL